MINRQCIFIKMRQNNKKHLVVTNADLDILQ